MFKDQAMKVHILSVNKPFLWVLWSALAAKGVVVKYLTYDKLYSFNVFGTKDIWTSRVQQYSGMPSEYHLGLLPLRPV
jgi:hypothetical protein